MSEAVFSEITVVSVSGDLACSLCFAALNDSGGGTKANDCRARALSAHTDKIAVKEFFFIGAHSTTELGVFPLKNR